MAFPVTCTFEDMSILSTRIARIGISTSCVSYPSLHYTLLHAKPCDFLNRKVVVRASILNTCVGAFQSLDAKIEFTRHMVAKELRCSM